MGKCLAFLGLLTCLAPAGCSRHGYAAGSVSYTSTPMLEDHAGALPLETLVCIPQVPQDYGRSVGVRLGTGCTLVGAYDARRGKGQGGVGVAQLVPEGVCALPTGAAPLVVRVQNATLEVLGEAVNVTVGGSAENGPYITYRFTGMMQDNDADAECDKLLYPQNPPSHATSVEPTIRASLR